MTAALPRQVVEWARGRALSVQHSPADTLSGEPSGSAVFGAGAVHRYALTRTWDDGPHAVFVLLNPSTASAHSDDPTLRRVRAFARREGYAGIVLANCFSLRATDPRSLRTRTPAALAEAVGEHTDALLALLAEQAADIIVGWGVWGATLHRAPAVEAILTRHGARLWALGTTRAGQPMHPLFLPARAPLVPYQPEVDQPTTRKETT
ncbi:DUF1643 domain-containing protein [Streptomyces sp. NPDC020983]|uniref:DUF1643 domain-containing protein n=1 Tax=Streptomyces sp. NPDC020983 TaxID=3365106 RepID=UPI0037A27FD1